MKDIDSPATCRPRGGFYARITSHRGEKIFKFRGGVRCSEPWMDGPESVYRESVLDFLVPPQPKYE